LLLLAESENGHGSFSWRKERGKFGGMEGDGKGLTLYRCGSTFDRQEHRHYRIRDTVGHCVAFPNNFELAAGLPFDGDRVHDDEACDRAINFLVRAFIRRFSAVTARLAADCIGLAFDDIYVTENTFQRPSYQILTSRAQREVLTARDSRSSKPSVFAQILRRHEAHFEVALDQNTGDQLRLLCLQALDVFLSIFGGLISIGKRRCDLRELANDFGNLLGLERDAQLLAVRGGENLDRAGLVCIERQKLRL
jgi:hypothetical protein